MKSLRQSRPGLLTWRSSPPVAPGVRWRLGVPESRLASVSVETDTTNGKPEMELSSSVFALDGGATRPSQTGSPSSRLATIVPSMA